MLKRSLLLLSLTSLLGAAACQQVSSSNDGAANNANVAKNVDKAPTGTPPANMAPIGNVVTYNGGAANVVTNVQPVNGMLAPGIPDPKAMKKQPVKPGATPTPGIPDPATIKQQLEKLYGKPSGANANANVNALPQVTPLSNANIKAKPTRRVRKP